MRYREFGNTGERISALGFGCMRLPEVERDGVWSVDQDKTDEMLRAAFALGVNYFDSAYYYCHNNSEAAVGRAVKPFRDKVLLSTKCPMGDEMKRRGDYRRFLETSLRRLDTDYVDFYHFWAIGRRVFDDKIIGMGLLEEALRAKEEGLIRHISFSFHDEVRHIRHIIDTAGVMETMLVQYNLLDRSHEEMIAYAAEKGLGVVAMGPVGGGRLAAPAGLYEKLTGKRSTASYELALRFVLGNQNISCALSGMETLEMVQANARIAGNEKPMDEQEWAQIAQAMEEIKKFGELYCTGCGYCQPCPQNIKIPHLFQLYTYYNVYGLTEYARKAFADYRANPAQHGNLLDACVSCGRCEKKCPQRLPILRELQKVEAVLGR